MALVLSISHTQINGGTTWVIADATGDYHVTTNPTGWGSPNLVIDDESITVATLSISKDGVLVHEFDLMDLGTWKDLTGYTTASAAFDALTTSDSLTYSITSTNLETDLEDGIYTVEYSVSDGSTPSTSTFMVALFGQLEKKLYQIAAEVPDIYTDHELPSLCMSQITAIWALYCALLYSARIADTTAFSTLLTSLQEITATYSCTDTVN